MLGLVHRIGDDAMPKNLEARVLKHVEVGSGVEMAPEHWYAEPALWVVVFRDVVGSEAQQGKSTALCHPVELFERLSVVFSGHMNDGVVRHHGLEAVISKRKVNEIGLGERGAKDESLGEAELVSRDVQPEDFETGVGEPFRDRHTGTTTGIEDTSMWREMFDEFGKQINVGSVKRSVGEIVGGDGVVAILDDLDAGVLHKFLNDFADASDAAVCVHASS